MPASVPVPSTARSPPRVDFGARGPWVSPGDGVLMEGEHQRGEATTRQWQPLPLVLPFLLHHLCPLCPCWWDPRRHNLGSPTPQLLPAPGRGLGGLCPGAGPRPARELPAAPALCEIICYFSRRTVRGPFPCGTREQPGEPCSHQRGQGLAEGPKPTSPLPPPPPQPPHLHE